MPREKPITDEDLSVPPVRRWRGPIIDSHTHMRSPDVVRLLYEVATEYGIDLVCGITHFEDIGPLQRAFGERYRPILWIPHEHIATPERFTRENVRLVHRAADMGAVGGKFWYGPRFIAESDFPFHHPALGPVFEALAERGMYALVHISDPDCWFATKYRDAARYRTKPDHYEQLEHTLAEYPRLTVVGAHFGGDPEDLAHIGRLLETYPNYRIDSSATKWISRELSRQPEAARTFIETWADRILFGSDLVTFPDADPEDYESRYWVHRWLWEGEGRRDSPIPDPCADSDGPVVEGLNLPEDVLRRLYHDNAAELVGVSLV